MRAIGLSLTGVGAGVVLAGACARQQPAISAATLPTAPLRFAVVGEAGRSVSGPPTVSAAGGVITIRGSVRQVEGGGVYADVDLSEPGTVRLTLYDSLPGRAVDAAPARGARFRQVRYEASVGPLPPGAYDVIIGWFDPLARLIEVRHGPLQVKVGIHQTSRARREST
jgi:hypothetical protein